MARGLRLLKSNFALHRPRMPSPHEITTDTTKSLPLSARAVPLCFLAQQVSTSCLARSSSRSIVEFQSTLPLSPLATVLSRTSPVPRQTYSSLN
jgi:hypothetical protein